MPHVANPDDLVLIYISSHGSASEMDVGGVNYIIAHDSEYTLDDPSRVGQWGGIKNKSEFDNVPTLE